MKKYSREFKVGVFFILCVVGFIYLVLGTGKVDIKQDGYYLYVVFDEIAGLNTKAPVMLNGREVGKVKDIQISYKDTQTKIILKLWVSRDAKVRDKATVSIKTLGLMGEKYIQIASSQGETFIEPETTLTGKPYMDLDVLMDQATTISADIGVLVSNVNGLTDEVKKLTLNLNDTVETNQESISRTIKNLEVTSENIEAMSQDIKAHPWKLLFRGREK